MKLDEKKVKEVLLSHGLSTRESERITKDLVSRDLFEVVEEKKKKITGKTVSEVAEE